MIEYEGWRFNFKNMTCLPPDGEPNCYMSTLHGVFLISHGYAYGGGYCWDYLGDDMRFSKKVYTLYTDWLIEEELLGP